MGPSLEDVLPVERPLTSLRASLGFGDRPNDEGSAGSGEPGDRRFGARRWRFGAHEGGLSDAAVAAAEAGPGMAAAIRRAKPVESDCRQRAPASAEQELIAASARSRSAPVPQRPFRTADYAATVALAARSSMSADDVEPPRPYRRGAAMSSTRSSWCTARAGACRS